MAEYWAFLNRLRHDLGKRYTVAQEHTEDPQRINLLIRLQRHAEMLVVMTDARWLALVQHENTPPLRVEYKHLVVAIRNFFTYYHDAPPFDAFEWPGTQESREAVRHALAPRRRRRLSLP